MRVYALKSELVEQSTSLSQIGNEDQSACNSEGHGGSIGNDYNECGKNSRGQSRRTSSDGHSNGGSDGFHDCDGFNNDHGLARIDNSYDSDNYDGGAWGCTNAARGTACGGSNSGGGASSIQDGMIVVRAVRGDSSGHGGGEARDTAGEALMMGTGVAVGQGGTKAGGGWDKGAYNGGKRGGCGCGDDGGNGADGDSCDGDECVGVERDGIDGSSSVDDASEITRDHAVEGANLIMCRHVLFTICSCILAFCLDEKGF